MDYLIHIGIMLGIYVILTVSLDLLAGHTGLLSLAQAAFYGIGAYTSAILTVRCGLPFWTGVLVGMGVAAGMSTMVSLPSLRLHDDYFIIATFSFQMILVSVLANWSDVTRGPLGIPGIPQPTVIEWKLQSQWQYLILIGAIAVLAYLISHRISRSPFGRVLHSIREDEVLARSLAKNTTRFKVSITAISTAMAAVAGSLYAHYITYIDPTSFTVMESILVVSMVIIGGAGSMWGPILGAAVLVTLPECLRFVGMPASVAANVRQVFYGGLLVVFMMWRPRGFLGEYVFQGKGARE